LETTRAPANAPAVILPWGDLLPWVGPGDQPFPPARPGRTLEGVLPAAGRRWEELWAAYLRDVANVDEAEVARQLGVAASEERHGAAERSTTARARFRLGRGLYRPAGVWPWASGTTGGGARLVRGPAVEALRRWASTEWPAPPEPVYVLTLSGTVCELPELLDLLDVLEPRALRLAQGGSLLVGWTLTQDEETSAFHTVLHPRRGVLRHFLDGFGGLGSERTAVLFRDAAVTVCVLADPTPAHRAYYPARGAPCSKPRTAWSLRSSGPLDVWVQVERARTPFSREPRALNVRERAVLAHLPAVSGHRGIHFV